APRAADPDLLDEAPLYGSRSVTVPGAVAGWADLLERHGTRGLDRCLGPAIDAAERGFAATPVVARVWQRLAPALAPDPELSAVFLPAPSVGQIVRLPSLGATLRRIAENGPDALYRGQVAAAIARASWLDEDDLAVHRSEWVEPLRMRYRDVEVVELPPNGQGAAALQALALIAGWDIAALEPVDRIHIQVEAVKLAFADAYRHIADGPLPEGYLDEGYLAERRRLLNPRYSGAPRAGEPPSGGTVYLCVVDERRMACS